MGLAADNRYLFTLDGVRQKINLGRFKGRALNRVVTHIEGLVHARLDNRPPAPADEAWAQDLGDERLRRRLMHLGLIQHRERSTLGQWLDGIERDQRDLTNGAFKKIRQTVAWLRASLASSMHLSLHRLNEQHALAFKSFAEKRLQQGLKPGTIRTHFGNARTIFNLAADRRLMTTNPFKRKDMAVGSTARTDATYVSWEKVERVISELKRPAEQLLLALARLTGIRVPSEFLTLRRSDFDRQAMRVCVHDEKRKQLRDPPLDERLLPYLNAYFATIDTDQEKLFLLTGIGGAMEKRIKKAARQAGVEMWPDRFQTLRASCEIEWRDIDGVPDSVIEKWLGHRPEVAKKHYNQRVADEAYAKYPIGPAGARNRAQQAPETVGMFENAVEVKSDSQLKSLGFSGTNRMVPIRAGSLQVEAGGIEPPS